MRAVGPLLLLLTGVVTVRLAVTGAYTAYVRVGMFWVLVVSGVLLAVLGLAGLWQLRGPQADEADDAGHDAEHDHAGPPGVAYLLLLPLVVAYVVSRPRSAPTRRRCRRGPRFPRSAPGSRR